MPYVTPHVKLSFGGTLADGLEIWSCGLSLLLSDANGNYESEFLGWKPYLPDYVTAVENFISNPDSRVPTGVQLNWVKGALVDTDGSYMMEPGEAPASATGGDSGGYIPQGALVYTLVSPRWKDPGRYNRFYLPTSAPTGSTAWRLTEAEADDAAAACALFLHSLYTLAPTAHATPIVASPAGTGWGLEVHEVRVGRLIDTQRRRRNAIAEDYSIEPINFTP